MTDTSCDRWTDEVLTAVACAATASTASVTRAASRPLGHRLENLTTAALDRVQIGLGDGSTVSVVAKTLRPASAAPAFAAIPPEHHQQVLEDLHWLDEPDVYRSGLADVLPEPLAMPRLLLVDDTQADRVTLWLEDVGDVVAWSPERYRRSAAALGTLAGGWTGAGAVSRFGLHGRSLERLFMGKITHFDLTIQAADEFWTDPRVRAAVDVDHRTPTQVAGMVEAALTERSASAPASEARS